MKSKTLGNLSVEAKIEKVSIIQMSASSISQVCNISRSQVLEILKEIFTKVIEISQKSKEEIILDFKIGDLVITDRHELVFRNRENFKEKTDRKNEIIKAIREADAKHIRTRENPNTSYDVNKVASDILSMHSGSSYYVSVATPRTKTRSVISSKQHGKHRRGQQWSFFKRGEDYQNETTRTASKFNKSGSISEKGDSSHLNKTRSQNRIPNPKKLFSNDGIMDKIDIQDPIKVYGSVERKREKSECFQTLKNEKLPFPYLASFINKHSGGVHFGKRMLINNLPNTNEVSSDQIKQIEQNKAKKIQEIEELKQKEFVEILQLKEDCIRDDIEREVDIKQKQQEFKRDMQQMQQHKLLKEQQEKDIKHTETYDYFPFTHGENIDNMKENYKRVVLSNMRLQNNSSNASKHSKTINRGKSTTKSLYGRTGLHNPLSNEYLVDDPKYKRFRSNERHPEVIKSALERFEYSLLQKEHEQMQYNEEFKQQIEHNKSFDQMMRDKILREQAQNRETLLFHMNENRKNQLREIQDRKKYIRTNYGPEDTDFTYIKYAQKKEVDQRELKKDLHTQINNKIQLKNNQKLDVEQDRKSLKVNKEIIDALKLDELKAKAENIQKNVKIWNKQHSIRMKEDQLNKLI